MAASVTIVWNNKVFSDTIQNFSTIPYTASNLTATIDHTMNHASPFGAQRELTGSRTCSEHARPRRLDPAAHGGRTDAVRPSVLQQPEHYWHAFFDTDRVIHEGYLGETV